MTALAPLQGYRLWARTYSGENAVSAIEARLVEAMTVPLAGKRLLDAGCGTGRRLRDTDAALAVGVDLSPEMLATGREEGISANVDLLVGDVRALPLPDSRFDVTWCRLVIGHLPECDSAYAELARVTAVAGQVIVTDFHPLAHAAGHRRTFRSGGAVHELEHHVHPITSHIAAAREVGLELTGFHEGRIGPDVRHFYDEAGRASPYEEHLGLPVVLALAFKRGG